VFDYLYHWHSLSGVESVEISPQGLVLFMLWCVGSTHAFSLYL